MANWTWCDDYSRAYLETDDPRMHNSATQFTLTGSQWDALDRLAEAYGLEVRA